MLGVGDAKCGVYKPKWVDYKPYWGMWKDGITKFDCMESGEVLPSEPLEPLEPLEPFDLRPPTFDLITVTLSSTRCNRRSAQPRVERSGTLGIRVRCTCELQAAKSVLRTLLLSTLLRLQRDHHQHEITQGAAALYPGLCAFALTARQLPT